MAGSSSGNEIVSTTVKDVQQAPNEVSAAKALQADALKEWQREKQAGLSPQVFQQYAKGVNDQLGTMGFPNLSIQEKNGNFNVVDRYASVIDGGEPLTINIAQGKESMDRSMVVNMIASSGILKELTNPDGSIDQAKLKNVEKVASLLLPDERKLLNQLDQQFDSLKDKDGKVYPDAIGRLLGVELSTSPQSLKNMAKFLNSDPEFARKLTDVNGNISIERIRQLELDPNIKGEELDVLKQLDTSYPFLAKNGQLNVKQIFDGGTVSAQYQEPNLARDLAKNSSVLKDIEDADGNVTKAKLEDAIKNGAGKYTADQMQVLKDLQKNWGTVADNGDKLDVDHWARMWNVELTTAPESRTTLTAYLKANPQFAQSLLDSNGRVTVDQLKKLESSNLSAQQLDAVKQIETSFAFYAGKDQTIDLNNLYYSDQAPTQPHPRAA